MNFDHKHYIPCLRWKTGEYQAVLNLSPNTKKYITPLIELPEYGWDFEENKNQKSLDQLTNKFAERISKKWGKTFCFVDVMKNIEYSDRLAGGTHPETFVFNKLREEKCLVVPVIGLKKDTLFLKEIKRIINKDQRGVCLRLTIEQAASSSLENNITELLSTLEIELMNCDFILDLGAPNYVPVDGFVNVILKIVKQLPHLNEWRTFVILGTSFPDSLVLLKEGINIVPRNEWQLYKKLVIALVREKLRIPTFGDYTINHPKILLMDMRIIKPVAKIRYTIDDNWIILKGKNHRSDPTQYFDFSKKLISSKYFCGKDFSYGDKYIVKCAAEKQRESLTRWREVDTNHHIEKLTYDISNYYAS